MGWSSCIVFGLHMQWYKYVQLMIFEKSENAEIEI